MSHAFHCYTPFHFPFPSWLLVFGFTWWQFCIVKILSGLKTFLHISSIFSRSLIGNFLSLAFFLFFDWEFSPFLFFFSFFLFSSESKDGHSHPGSRFMVSWDFGSRLVEWLDMTYVRVWLGSGITCWAIMDDAFCSFTLLSMLEKVFTYFYKNLKCLHHSKQSHDKAR